MQQDQLNRLLNLMRRTGEKCFIFDQEGEGVFALMDLDDYEDLLSGGEPVENLTEQEMLDRVNRELSNWRSWQESEHDFSELEPKDEPTSEIESEIPDFTPAEPDLEPILEESGLVEPKFEPEPETEHPLVKEESLEDVPEDEEEKFYLEPVE